MVFEKYYFFIRVEYLWDPLGSRDLERKTPIVIIRDRDKVFYSFRLPLVPGTETNGPQPVCYSPLDFFRPASTKRSLVGGIGTLLAVSGSWACPRTQIRGLSPLPPTSPARCLDVLRVDLLPL